MARPGQRDLTQGIAPLIVLGIALYPVRIGFAVLAGPVLGSDALWWSFPVGSTAALAMAATYYRWGNWRKVTLAPPTDPDEAEEQSLAGTEPAGRLQPGG